MPVPIKVNSTDVVITPLFDMQHKETLHNYRKGLRCRTLYESGPCSMRELVSSLKRATRTYFFDKKSARDIYQCVGFDFGYIHGAILTSERTLRPDGTTLVTFDDNQDAIQEYHEPDQQIREQDTEPLTPVPAIEFAS